MSVLDGIFDQVLIYSYYPAYRRFIVSTKQVKAIQEKILKGIIAKNRKTVFGRDHSFSLVNSYESFKRHVPLCEYEDYSLLQPTSGSTEVSKFIPYTKELKKDFQRSLGP